MQKQQLTGVTVVVISYNNASFIGQTLESVLAQTGVPLEVFVFADGASDDFTAAFEKHQANPHIHYMRNAANLGMAGNYNRSFYVGQGSYVVVLEAGDVMYPGHLLTLFSALELHPDAALAYTQHEQIDAHGIPLAYAAHRGHFRRPYFGGRDELVDLLIHGNYINASATMLRRSVLERVHLPDGQWLASAPGVWDWELWTRIARTVPDFIFLQQASIGRRNPPPSASIGISDEGLLQHTRILELNLEDRAVRQRLRKEAAAIWKHYQEQLAAYSPDVQTRYKKAAEAIEQTLFSPDSATAPDKTPTQAPVMVSNPSRQDAKEEPQLIWREYQRRDLATKGAPNHNQIEGYLQYLIAHRISMHEANAFDAHFAKLGIAPTFEIVVVHNGEDEPLVRTFSSAGRWLYDRFHLTVLSTVDAPEPDNDRVTWRKIVPGGKASYWPEIVQCFAETRADWVMVLEAGDELVDHGLLYLAEHALRSPDSVMLYVDEDSINAALAPDRPYLKPDFSPDYFLAFDYLSDGVAFRRQAVQDLGGLHLTDNDPLRGVALRLFARFGGAVGHIPDILLHRYPVRSLDRQLLGNVAEPALRELLPAARITPGLLPGGVGIDYPVNGAPSVLMVAEACADLPVLQRFVEQIWRSGTHGNVGLALLAAADLPGSVIQYLQGIDAAGQQGLAVHFGASGQAAGKRLTAAIAGSSAELLLLARPGIAPADPTWIERLAGHALQPRTGVVAPRLVDGNGYLIGNALLLGMDGFAVALGHGEAADAPGYFGRLLSAQNPSALTPEVAMISRAALEAAGSFDAGLGLTAALIDLSLRCKRIGRDNLWTPDITVACHFASPGKIAPGEEALLLERWLPQMARDPAYNVNLSRKQPFALHEYPQVSKLRLPWKPLPRLMALPGDNDGCGYHRVIDPFTATCAAGLIDGCISPGHYGSFDLVAFEADTIFVQRQFTDAQIHYLDHYRRFFKTKIVYELDDLATMVPDESLFKAGVPKDIDQRLRKALGLCDRFVVTTEALKEAYRGLIDDIRVVPNYIDRGRWEGLAPRRRIGEKPRVGWAGGASHTGDLALIVDLVKATADEVDWIFFGFCIDEIKPYVKEFHPGVSVPDYPAKLASLDLDLAIAPIAENAFNDCKSNLKLLEYGILGFPVIASNFGPYQRAKDFPVTLVKNRHQDWLDALRTHIYDLDAAARRGDALREHIQRHWMLQNHVDEWRQAWFDFPA